MEKKTILLLEDDMDVRNFLKLELSQHYRVKDFRHGKTALEYLEEGHIPDLIVTDLVMPRMDGMTFIGLVREMEWGPTVPILILTGVTANDDVPAHVWKEGTAADEFMEKPLRDGELLSVVAKWLDRYAKKNAAAVEEQKGDGEMTETDQNPENMESVRD